MLDVFLQISNYILFNYKDQPEELYERLRINIELNRELGIQIFSFPMKYSPIDRTDRDFIGTNWTLPCPEQFKEILPYYLIKHNGKKSNYPTVLYNCPLWMNK